jgi:hypothetical protein
LVSTTKSDAFADGAGDTLAVIESVLALTAPSGSARKTSCAGTVAYADAPVCAAMVESAVESVRRAVSQADCGLLGRCEQKRGGGGHAGFLALIGGRVRG